VFIYSKVMLSSRSRSKDPKQPAKNIPLERENFLQEYAVVEIYN